MKKRSKYLLIFVLLIFTLLPGLGAAAEEGIDFGDEVGYHPETGQLTFLGSNAGSAINLPGAGAQGFLPADRANAILEVYAPLFGEPNPAENLTQTALNAGSRGQTSTRYQQTYRGIPVFAGELIVNQSNRGELQSMIGELSPGLDLSVRPGISARQAAETARSAIAKYYGGEAGDFSASEPELWIYDERLVQPSSRPANLVWRMEVSGMREVPVRALVLIDAQQGFISLQFNQIDTFWSGELIEANIGGGALLGAPETASQFAGVVPRETYTSGDTSTLPGTLLCDSADPTCTGAGGDLDAVYAHQYAGDTFVYYYDNHGRDSINDAGMTLISSVHWRDPDDPSYPANPYYNAFWNGAQMVYGDGLSFARADDVVGHELTHGVTQFTSNLMYYYQSGAINESFSDLWGEFVDQTNGSGSDDPGDRWLLGEDLNGSGTGAIRSMSDPMIYGDPDKMTSANYYTNQGDQGGVHYNSGVNNKAVYLMVDGGSFNGQTVTGIGIDKVAAIYYEVQTSLLTSGSDYLNLYYSVQQACSNQIGGAEGITTADCEEVKKALWAVEMNIEPVYGFNPEADICPSGTTVSNIFYDSFESGVGLWTTNSVSGTPWVWGGGYATTGLYDYWGEDLEVSGELYTQFASAVTLPTTTDPLYLRFNHSYDFDWWTGGEYYDGGILEYSVNSGAWADAGALFVDGQDYIGPITDWGDPDPNPRLGEWAFSGPSHGYVSSRYAVSSFNGSTINFRWTVATDSLIGNYGWDIDDVQIYQCIGSPTLHFWDDFETTDFSLWTRVNTGKGYLYPCTDAGITGSWGACVDRGTDKRKQLIDETPVSQSDYNVRFNIDMNSLNMANGTRFRFVQVKMGADRPFFIVLKYQGGEYLIQLNTLQDDLTKVKTGWYPLSNAPHTLEIEWQAASAPGANDGRAAFYLDGVMLASLLALDNDTIFVDTFKIGFTSRLDGKAISGIFYLDDIATSNAGYIGLP